MTDRLLRLPEVTNRTGLSPVTIWRREKAGTFPARVKIGPHSVAWRESDIAVWIAAPMQYGKAA
jgi:prophage regulatory protein